MTTLTGLLKAFTGKIFSEKTKTTQTLCGFENIDAIVKNGPATARPFSFNYLRPGYGGQQEKEMHAIHGGLSVINYRLKTPSPRFNQNPLGAVVYQNLYAV